MDFLFFVAAKIIWLLISPDLWIVVLSLLAVYYCYRNSLALLKKVLGVLASLVVAITVLPLGEWLLYPLESRYRLPASLPDNIDGIVVLGGGELPGLSQAWGQVELDRAAERYTNFIELIRRYPEAQAVVSGGSGSLRNQSSKGADVIKALLASQGIDTTRIVFERESRNTFENLLLSKEIVQPRTGEQWLIVSTAYHLPRVMAVAEKLKWPLIPYPVDHYALKNNLLRIDLNFSASLSLLKLALHEYVGLVAYLVFGKSASLFPG